MRAFAAAIWLLIRDAAPTIAVSAAGGLVALALGLPAALLLGGALAVTLFALLGGQAKMPLPIRNVAFVIIGMTLGTNVAHDTLHLITRWPLTLLGLAVLLVIVVMTSGTLLNKVFGVDRSSAFLSAFPGHLSFVLAVAESGHGDPRRIAIIQTIRVLMLTVSVPIAASFLAVEPLNTGPAAAQMDFVTLGVLVLACTAGGFVFQRLNIPAGFVLGAMAVATLGKLMGLYDGALPWIFPAFSFVIMGCLIGSRFTGVKLAEFWRAAVGGTVVTGVALIATTGIAWVLTPMVHLPFGQVWIGLAPGGLEAMGALGIALGYDTAFIAAHHTARLFMLSLSVPLVMRIIERRGPSSSP